MQRTAVMSSHHIPVRKDYHEWEVTIGEVTNIYRCWEWKSTAYMKNGIEILLEKEKQFFLKKILLHDLADWLCIFTI